jgi:hypothetical protein
VEVEIGLANFSIELGDVLLSGVVHLVDFVHLHVELELQVGQLAIQHGSGDQASQDCCQAQNGGCAGVQLNGIHTGLRQIE